MTNVPNVTGEKSTHPLQRLIKLTALLRGFLKPHEFVKRPEMRKMPQTIVNIETYVRPHDVFMNLLIWKLYSDLRPLLICTSCIALATAVIIKIIILAAEFDRAEFFWKPHFEQHPAPKYKNIIFYITFSINT